MPFEPREDDICFHEKQAISVWCSISNQVCIFFILSMQSNFNVIIGLSTDNELYLNLIPALLALPELLRGNRMEEPKRLNYPAS